MGTTRRLWNTEPLWAWRLAVVLWWMVVAFATFQAVGVGIAVLHAIFTGGN